MNGDHGHGEQGERPHRPRPPHTIEQLWERLETQFAILQDQLHRVHKHLTRKLNLMSAELDQLEVDVTESTTVQQSAIELLGGLAAQIRALANDPVKLRQLSTVLDAKKDALATAIQENTTTPPPNP